MLGNLIALLIIKVVNQMMFPPSVCVAYSNAPCSETFPPESLGVDLPSLNKRDICLLFRRQKEI